MHATHLQRLRHSKLLLHRCQALFEAGIVPRQVADLLLVLGHGHSAVTPGPYRVMMSHALNAPTVSNMTQDAHGLIGTMDFRRSAIAAQKRAPRLLS